VATLQSVFPRVIRPESRILRLSEMLKTQRVDFYVVLPQLRTSLAPCYQALIKVLATL
jgi:hypothetical protein